jgi:hypothetical protein
LKDVSPNEVLGDIMTEDQYIDDDDEVVKEEDKKKKSMAFKAVTSSSKNKSKGKAKKEDSSDEECSNKDSDNEALALFVCKFGKMMKKGYHIRKRRDSKNKEYARLCYKCKSPDHIVGECPYNSDNEHNKKKNKKEKKEKTER